jgi:polysaccharide deacetylase family protein (PEP-CTERM system associated)
MINALTIDVEDYFQVNAFTSCVRRDEWDKYPLRVECNMRRILAMLDEFGIKATFFILGWVAERLPTMVKEIQGMGHEIACHGYGHELIYRIGPERFRADIRRSKSLLEDIGGVVVNGYRAPSYSITKQSLWALDILVEEGFTYDSSMFPILHDIYGIPGGKRFPHEIQTQSGTIMEFPLSTFPMKVGRWEYRLPIAGGGYLRLLPALFVGQAIRYINTCERQPAVVYFHPWEIDPHQPRIRAGLKSCFRHYLNLGKMEAKIKYLLNSVKFSAIQDMGGFERQQS